MKDAVGDVLAARARSLRGMNRFVSVSMVAHVLVIAFLVFAPAAWFSSAKAQPKIITINLGGGDPTPDKPTGGLTAAAARPVEQVAPEPKRSEPIKPAAPRRDVMAVPDKLAPRTPTQTVDTPIPETPVAQPPTKGPEKKPGDARAETNAKTNGPGLSMGGGGGQATIDAEDFCCMEYAQEVLEAIRKNWRWSEQAEKGFNTVRFTIERDGRITGVDFDKKSGNLLLDAASKDAFGHGLLLPKLPVEYKQTSLTIHLTFNYNIK